MTGLDRDGPDGLAETPRADALDSGKRRRHPLRNAAGVLLLLATAACGATTGSIPGATDSLEIQRIALVEKIEAAGVHDSATLAAMRRVPRHEFVPTADRPWAYADEPRRIGHGQTISQPYIVGFMTEAIRPRTGMKVLEIGTGSGYQAAVLAAIGCRVYTIEIIRPLADSARARLARLGYAAQVRHGDGYRGWPEEAPFDAIVVTAAPDTMPGALVDQLGRRGRMVAPVGPENAVQSLVLLEKDAGGRVSQRELLPVRFVPMKRGEP